MKLVEHYIMRGTRRLVLIIVGFLIFIFASYSAQRYLTEAANGTLALDVVLAIAFGYLRVSRRYALFYPIGTVSRSQATIVANFHRRYDCRYRRLRQIGIASRSIEKRKFFT